MQFTGTFLYYSRAVTGTMLTTLSTITSKQLLPTECTINKCEQLLDYAKTQTKPILTYQSSDMVLAIHRDTYYLSKPRAHSRVVGHHLFLAKLISTQQCCGPEYIPTHKISCVIG